MGDLLGAVREYFSDSVFDKATSSGLQVGLQKLIADDVLGRVKKTGERIENFTLLDYAAAKAALASFTKTCALELARSGITVNAVSPGPTETELFRENTPTGSDAEKQFLSMMPMNRFGKPDEAASAVEFLLSDDAGFMTGQTLYVDGGASIGKLTV